VPMAASARIAAQLAAHDAYSYRRDAAVPAFADDAPLIVYDGVCVLCSAAMRWIATSDRRARYRYASAQSDLGQALFRHYRLDPVNFETVLLIENGRAYGKLDMACRVSQEIGGPWRIFSALGLLPGRVQDWCYDRIAKNRYRLFGQRDVCIMPDASWRARVINGETATK
jgi:predicted DCC family thiol-disulfide oxidoreductase YuxK